MASFTIVLDTEHCPKRMMDALFVNLSAAQSEQVSVIWSIRSNDKSFSFSVPVNPVVFQFTSKMRTLPVGTEVSRGKYASACAGGFLNGYAAACSKNVEDERYILVSTRATTFSPGNNGSQELGDSVVTVGC